MNQVDNRYWLNILFSMKNVVDVDLRDALKVSEIVADGIVK